MIFQKNHKASKIKPGVSFTANSNKFSLLLWSDTLRSVIVLGDGIPRERVDRRGCEHHCRNLNLLIKDRLG